MKYQLEKFVLKLITVLFCWPSEKIAVALGRSLGRALFYLAGARRRLALENVQLAYQEDLKPMQKREVVFRSFEYLGTNVVEFFRMPTLEPKELLGRVDIEGQDHLDKALGNGQGVLLLSAHLGNWDYLSAAIAMNGYPLALITKVSRSEALNDVWMGHREKTGVTMLMGRGTMKDSLKHLKRGGVVGFVLDQNARRKEGVFVPFFGKQACTLSSLAILSRRTRAPVIPVHTFRSGGVHKIIIGEPILIDRIEDQELDILERTTAYTRWTEKVIREHPEQWTWLHNRWKTRPIDETTERPAEEKRDPETE